MIHMFRFDGHKKIHFAFFSHQFELYCTLELVLVVVLVVELALVVVYLVSIWLVVFSCSNTIKY